MTRKGPSRKVDPSHTGARRAKARLFLKAARDASDNVEAGGMADPAISLIATATIAYADALTAKFAGEINRTNHAAVVKLLADALGRDFTKEQQTRLARLLSRKDEAQYGAGSFRKPEAEKLLADLEKFAAWAEELLGA